jgi:hypothetical protein
MIRFFLIFFALGVPINSVALGPFAGPNYKVYKLGYLEGGLQLERFYSDANFDDKGKESSLGTNYTNYLRSYDYTYSVRLAYTKNFALSGGFIARSVDSDDGTLVRSRTGIGEIYLGADYRWLLGETEAIIDYRIAYSPFVVPNSESTEHPIWGDGANSSQGLLILQRKFDSLMIYAFGGYNYRDNGLSDYYPLGFGLQKAVAGWIVGGETKLALLGDKDVHYTPDNSERHDQLKQVNAGSLKYYSTNPEWVSIELNFKYRLTTQFAFNGGGGTILKGFNVADGNFFYLGLQLQWPVFLQEITGQAEVQKKEPYFVPDTPTFKKKPDEINNEPTEHDKNTTIEDNFNSDE